MNDQSTGRNSGGTDPADDPDLINLEVGDAIKKELQRTDLSPDDRKAYEDALAKVEKETQ
jgi:hypothetical protein